MIKHYKRNNRIHQLHKPNHPRMIHEDKKAFLANQFQVDIINDIREKVIVEVFIYGNSFGSFTSSFIRYALSCYKQLIFLFPILQSFLFKSFSFLKLSLIPEIAHENIASSSQSGYGQGASQSSGRLSTSSKAPPCSR